jgi:hypothetical protein
LANRESGQIVTAKRAALLQKIRALEAERDSIIEAIIILLSGALSATRKRTQAEEYLREHKKVRKALDEALDEHVRHLDDEEFPDRKRINNLAATYEYSRREPGRPPEVKVRDFEIAAAVASVVRLGFHATRSHAVRRRKDPSACSLVQVALGRLGKHISERTIEGIWNRCKTSAIIQEILRTPSNQS